MVDAYRRGGGHHRLGMERNADPGQRGADQAGVPVEDSDDAIVTYTDDALPEIPPLVIQKSAAPSEVPDTWSAAARMASARGTSLRAQSAYFLVVVVIWRASMRSSSASSTSFRSMGLMSWRKRLRARVIRERWRTDD